jgi:hypothetical protein
MPDRKSGDVHDAGLALHDQVVPRTTRLRAALSEARDGAVDEPGIVLPQAVVAETEPLHRAGPEVLEHHVRRLDQRPEDLLPFRRLQVQREALLVAVHGEEIRGLAARERRPAPRVVALAGLLDLDDLGAHVAEGHGAERPGEHARQVDDAHARQRRIRRGDLLPRGRRASLRLSVLHGRFLSRCP